MDKDTFSSDELGRKEVDLGNAVIADRIRDGPAMHLPLFMNGEEKVRTPFTEVDVAHMAL